MLRHGHCPFTRLTLLWVFLFACVTRPLYATPVADLASPVQSVRDAAAAFLRANYTPPARTNWDGLLASLKIGEAETNIEARLDSIGVTNACGFDKGLMSHTYYQLDDAWVLYCNYTISNSTLAAVEILNSVRSAWLNPPPHFTGRWVVYYVNGQKCNERYCQDGKSHGPDTYFNHDGSKRTISHYVHGLAEGERISYYPDGRIETWSAYKAGQPVGRFINYNEDGSVRSITDNKTP